MANTVQGQCMAMLSVNLTTPSAKKARTAPTPMPWMASKYRALGEKTGTCGVAEPKIMGAAHRSHHAQDQPRHKQSPVQPGFGNTMVWANPRPASTCPTIWPGASSTCPTTPECHARNGLQQARFAKRPRPNTNVCSASAVADDCLWSQWHDAHTVDHQPKHQGGHRRHERRAPTPIKKKHGNQPTAADIQAGKAQPKQHGQGHTSEPQR